MRAALDKDNKLIHVLNAKTEERYYCQWCRCPVQIRIKNGIENFDVVPGHAHSNNSCKKHGSRFPDLWMTSSRELQRNLLLQTDNVQDKSHPKKDQGEGMLRSAYRETNYSVVPFRFISEFRKEGVYTWPADTELNGYQLTDLFVSRKNAAVLMHDNKPLGFRIVDVKFSRLVGTNTLRFAMCYTVGAKKIRYFDLHIADEEEYQILKREVLTYRNANYYIAGRSIE